MIRLPLVLQVNTFMKQLHPLNTITVDFKSNCQDETEVMKAENPSKSIAAFNVESTDVTKRHLWFCNWKRALQESGDQLYTITDSWCHFNQQLQCQQKLVTSYSTFIYIHYEVSLDFLARSVVQVKKCGRSIFSVLKWVKCSPTTFWQSTSSRVFLNLLNVAQGVP